MCNYHFFYPLNANQKLIQKANLDSFLKKVFVYGYMCMWMQVCLRKSEFVCKCACASVCVFGHVFEQEEEWKRALIVSDKLNE